MLLLKALVIIIQEKNTYLIHSVIWKYSILNCDCSFWYAGPEDQ